MIYDDISFVRRLLSSGSVMASLILGLMLTVHSVLHNYFVTDVPKVTKGPGRVVTTDDFLSY